MIIQPAHSDEMGLVRSMFREYQESLGIDLCFQSFDQELAGLPGDYAPPSGCLLLAEHGAGCVALRRIDDATGEMKRLYVRPAFRGKRLGRQLADAVIAEARRIGYRRVWLDTLPSMREAIGMYRSMGFVDCPAYRHNPVEGALFLELTL